MSHDTPEAGLIEAAWFTPVSLQYPDAWVGHLPFAAWLVRQLKPSQFVELGTHSGNSYFAFCQAVQEHGLQTRCYAVDSWEGDEHAGQYAQEVFEAVDEHNRTLYSRFSRLLRMYFDDAVSYFPDASVELLHIDGLHTYEAVRHDFETWLPKLAPGAVVLFHDTNVREWGFGVWQFWAELRQRYPLTLEFDHSNGLGVLQLEGGDPERELTWLKADETAQLQLKRYFAALGQRQIDRFYRESHDKQMREFRSAAEQSQHHANTLQQHAHNLELRDKHLQEQIGLLQQHAENLDQARTDLDQRVQGLNESLTQKAGSAEKLEAATQRTRELEKSLKEHTEHAEDLRRRLNEIRQSRSWRLTNTLRRGANLLRRLKNSAPAAAPLPAAPGAPPHSPGAPPRVDDRLAATFANEFSAEYYLAQNPDVAAMGVDPLEHYIQYGRAEGRLGKPPASTAPVLLDESEFSAEFYLKHNPDVAALGIDPREHYIHYGKKEGRAGAPPKLVWQGSLDSLDAPRETVLVVGHEGSRTGAPILTYNLVVELLKKYNVIAMYLAPGPMLAASRAAGAVVAGFSARAHLSVHNDMADEVLRPVLDAVPIKFAVVNSVEGRGVLAALARRFVPSVTLIHEFAGYVLPRGGVRDAIYWSGRTAFSANLTRDSAFQAEVSAYPGQEFPVIPQGRCIVPQDEVIDADKPVNTSAEQAAIRAAMRPDGFPAHGLVVLGAGSVQLRKGTDLFIECANRVMELCPDIPCRFVWVGHGYAPETDYAFSVYLADQIERAGLQGKVVFLDAVSDLDAVYAAADMLLLTSRLDPLPNVAIDAMTEGLPVLCFDKTTGIADILHEQGLGDTCVAKYMDTHDLSNKLRDLIANDGLRKQISDRSAEVARTIFNMAHYAAEIEGLAAVEAERARQERLDTETIAQSDLFDQAYSVPPWAPELTRTEAARRYVRGWASKVNLRKPCAGFHPGIYLEQHGVATPHADPFADYLRAGCPQGPWNAELIGLPDGTGSNAVAATAASPAATAEGDTPAGGDTAAQGQSLRVGLHIHAFYPDLLPEALERLAQNRTRIDLLVSAPSDQAAGEVAKYLVDYKGGDVEIRVVPNRGRDIGPFLTEFGELIRSRYDVIGHIHTKKTIHNESMGQPWYRFILENLVGGKAPMADTILSAMQRDEKIGLVFPDDPYVMSWTKNRPYAQDIASRLGIHQLPDHFSFPVGTMFWARVSCLEGMFGLGLQWGDYPEEPLANDGTVLHALERLFPVVVQHAGNELRLTHVPGVTR